MRGDKYITNLTFALSFSCTQDILKIYEMARRYQLTTSKFIPLLLQERARKVFFLLCFSCCSPCRFRMGTDTTNKTRFLLQRSYTLLSVQRGHHFNDNIACCQYFWSVTDNYSNGNIT